MACSGRASSPRWVLDAVLRQAGAWRRTSHELSVAVNVSTRSLLDRDFSDQVADRLAAWGVPGCLMPEVTESAVMADPALPQEVLGRLQPSASGWRWTTSAPATPPWRT